MRTTTTTVWWVVLGIAWRYGTSEASFSTHSTSYSTHRKQCLRPPSSYYYMGRLLASACMLA